MCVFLTLSEGEGWEIGTAAHKTFPFELGCAVEDLAIVVLTHELAHAFTQLGADIEGRRRAAPSFAKAETPLKEGLAQYYTQRVLFRPITNFNAEIAAHLEP